MSPDSFNGLYKKRSTESEDDIRKSETSFLKRMPLFNQF